MAAEESSFPRGGAAPDGAATSAKTNLFDQSQKKKTKSKKKLKHHVVTGAEPKLTALSDLSYKILTEGMIVLGRVTEITDYYLQVSLPGLTVGRAPITQISESYSKLLQSSGQNDDNIEALCPLSELFYKGQLVTAQVWQIRRTEEGKHLVSLSLDPKDVHAAWSHTAMAKEGLVVTAAVKSKEEHGYVMDCGVNGLRCFLKEEKATNYCNTFNGGRPLAVGQLVPCIITKAEASSVTSKIELSADPQDVAQQEEAGYPAVDKQLILPGMRFKLTVTEPMRDGVEVKFFGLSGYIHRNHVPRLDSQQDISMPEPGTALFGRVLYITPLVKNIYFSALPHISSTVEEIPKPSPAEVHFNIGDIIESAKVTGVGGKGLFLQLGKKNLDVRGFVPERRMGFNYKGKMEDNDDESTMLHRLRSKFPLKSSVRCRLLFFDTLSATYICSMEKPILDERYLSYSDVQVGNVVPCIVENIQNGGINIKVGMLHGFVPATHSADIPLHQPAKKFPPGTRVSGRVLKVDKEKHTLIVTLKQTLVSSQDPIIASYQSPRIGVSYTGTAVAITDTGVYVSFFGNVKGLLEKNDNCVPQDHKFFLGQLLKCYVIRRSTNQLRLSLIPPTVFKHNKAASSLLNIGQSYSLEVVSVSSAGLQVKVTDEDSYNAAGVIPVYHLSDDLEMAKSLLNTFEVGTILTNVWCFSDGSSQPIVFSMRSSVVQFFKSTHGKIANKKSIEAVSPGWVLPCSINKIGFKHILLEVPLRSLKDLVKVNIQHVCDEGETITSLGLVEGQSIQAKVNLVLENKNTLIMDCRKSKIWNNDLETCILHLSKYISDQQRLHAYAKKAGNPLGAYDIGGEVSGLVCERTEWGFILRLNNGARGEVTFYNAQSDQLEIGTRVNGKVLHVDCLREHVEITLCKAICSTLKRPSFENIPNLKSDVQLRGPTLLVTPEFVLVQLKGAGKLNLAYIPTHLYPYGMSALSIPEPFFGIDRKVIVKRFNNRIIICLPKEIVKSYTKKIKSNRLKQDRYFKLKQEKEEEESQRILDTHNDTEIIDKDIDNISDEEFVDMQSESDMEWHDIADERTELSSLKSEDEKENVSEDDSSNGRKRKSCKTNVEDKSGSSLKKSKQENGNGVVSKLKMEKEKKAKSSNASDDVQVVELKKRKRVEKKAEEEANLSDDVQVVELIKKNMKEKKVEREVNQSDDVQVETKKKKRKIGSKGEEDMDSGLEHSSEKQDTGDSSTVKNTTLKNPGFLWDIDPAKFMQVLEPGKHEASSDDSDSDDELSKKKNRKKTATERREAARLEEERLQKVEKDLLDPNRQLSSCDDFDRMVLANPDSSAVWLQYMAFHLQATEIEKARAIAQRAIKSISYREEQEKLNVWLGLLNLENLYGTSESLKTTLDEALQCNDPYKIRAHMVRMYAESAKNKELESEVRLVLKKFKETPGMWQEIGSILMNQGYAEKARYIMQQALQTLKNTKDSVSLIVQFALMEARNNNFDQAKTMMDSILLSYPQRIDIWCTYCDMLIKANQINEARELLETSVSQKLPARKMKTLFTKYLQFEQAHGSKESQEKVKSKASDYVRQAAGGEPMNDD